ncbi:MAG TPA: TraB/GumN family protein [Chitinophagaceae bacterium]
MKQIGTGFLLTLMALVGCAQKSETIKISTNPNTLLWKISGNGLEKASYLFGTIHMLCEDDAVLSANLKKAIKNAEDVYLEVDMDNIMEMFGVMGQMKMTGDTTLQDLLTKEEYEKVKDYFESKQSMIPFAMLETFKPILAASTLEQGDLPCESTSSMEQVIMAEAKQQEKSIKGLETMSYQAGMLDSIPYKLQAQQLVNYINNVGKEDDGKETKEMLKAYNEQDLNKLEEMIKKSDAGISSFTDLLLYNRNRNWVKKLKKLMAEKPLLVAVGAGHLPGDQGVINLLRKAGYTVEPVENKVSKTKEI